MYIYLLSFYVEIDLKCTITDMYWFMRYTQNTRLSQKQFFIILLINLSTKSQNTDMYVDMFSMMLFRF